MALKTIVPFPIFAPIFPFSTTNTTSTATPTTEVRFSRWNNANAEKFLRQKRTQKEIEDDIRRYRRFESAISIANLTDSTNTTTTATDPTNNKNSNFKSIGTPSTPSLPSIPGKKSKYSKNPNSISIRNRINRTSHPAFQKVKRKSMVPEDTSEEAGETNVKIGKDGLSYVVAGAPFEYMYSYTETPKVKPLALREHPVAPFETETMTRPWTGRKPLPPSKKKLPEFDSFVSPPVKKGVKPVQKPGPFLPGSGPRYVMKREDLLGEPLTAEEVKLMVEGCRKTKRQLNIGRDGLTHNMLDNIHALWKRRRVCKIKCKGVCTVDMNNVCEQLEEKSGGKVIYRKGGVLYLFRGRNYNYRTRPRFPLMLWKPISPVYPRLIQRVPEGLTYDEATSMRRRGHHLPPICKLAKNGVYVNLVKQVREAFEACELVRINCQGLNSSDYRKIAAKLKDLVPCVLISFQEEHILMWRGRNWKSSFSAPEDSILLAQNPKTDDAPPAGSYTSDDFELSESDSDSEGDPEQVMNATPDVSTRMMGGSDVCALPEDDQELHETSAESLQISSGLTSETDASFRGLEDKSTGNSREHNRMVLLNSSTNKTKNLSNFCAGADDATKTVCNSICGEVPGDDNSVSTQHGPPSALVGSEVMLANLKSKNQLETSFSPSAHNVETQHLTEASEASTREILTSTAQKLASPSVEGVLLLLNEAVECGRALVLDDACLDADVVFERSVALAKVAPPGPIFRRRPRKVLVENPKDKEGSDEEVVEEVVPVLEKQVKEKRISKPRRPRNFKDNGLVVVPQGTLGVDELAKLLA